MSSGRNDPERNAIGTIRQLATAATASGVSAREPMTTPMARNAVTPRISTGSASGQLPVRSRPKSGSRATPRRTARPARAPTPSAST